MRPPDIARVALAVPLLARPALPGRLLGDGGSDGVTTLTRFLAVRWLAQAAIGTAVARRRPATAPLVGPGDATVEILHAVSMLGAAARFPRHTRLALTSAATAAVLATLDLATQRRSAGR